LNLYKIKTDFFYLQLLSKSVQLKQIMDQYYFVFLLNDSNRLFVANTTKYNWYVFLIHARMLKEHRYFVSHDVYSLIKASVPNIKHKNHGWRKKNIFTDSSKWKMLKLRRCALVDVFFFVIRPQSEWLVVYKSMLLVSFGLLRYITRLTSKYGFLLFHVKVVLLCCASRFFKCLQFIYSKTKSMKSFFNMTDVQNRCDPYAIFLCSLLQNHCHISSLFMQQKYNSSNYMHA
jgi:hypothetical protein